MIVLRIQHNTVALFASNGYCRANNKAAKTLEKLSSGFQINRASDDAAGLSISEKFQMQMTGFNRASKNVQDGIQLVCTAEGALQEAQEMLHRMTYLAEQSANGTFSHCDRNLLVSEFNELKREIDRISRSSNFNGQKLFQVSNSSVTLPKSAKSYNYRLSFGPSPDSITVDFENVDNRDRGLSVFEARDMNLVGAVGLSNTSSEVANKVANELIPNATVQLLNAFPALKAAHNDDKVELGLRIYSDASSSVLAYAQASYNSTPGAKPMSMLVAVNTAKFPDAESLETGKSAGELKSSIMHELMHSIMQYNLPDGMTPLRGARFPDWFIEGTAQVAGGGFTANWNEWIRNPIIGIKFGVLDGEEVVRKWGLDDPKMGEYAQGYLATAYLGHLAAGNPSTVTASAISNGLNSIFEKLTEGRSFDEALQSTTGLNRAGIEALFGPTASASKKDISKLGDFVWDLGTAVGSYGAGSVVADGGLSTKPIAVIDSKDLSTSPFYVGKVNTGAGVVDLYDPVQNTPPAGWKNSSSPTASDKDKIRDLSKGVTGPPPAAKDNVIRLQIGIENTEYLDIHRHAVGVSELGLDKTNIGSQEEALRAIDQIKQANNQISAVRGDLGAICNRLEHTITNLQNALENITEAESHIRDADMGKEVLQHTKNQIILQAVQTILAHTNMTSKGVLSLLS